MPTRDIVVIGSSAGGVDALQRLCAHLPADFPAALFVAQHLSPSARSVLPLLLDRAGPLPATAAVEGQRITPGHIYVAPPDRHLLLREGHMLVRRGPYENRTRPAANALFRSAAIHYGARAIGVVLTGLLDDGTEGLIAIKAAGGVSIVQDPADAEWPSMPRNALERDHVDHAVPLDAMAALLTRLAAQDAGPSVALSAAYLLEDSIAAHEFGTMDAEIVAPGAPSHIGCPDCGGVLNLIEVEDAVRFRCQIGHAFTPDGLSAAQNDELERALGVAVRTHRDRLRLFRQMGDTARARGLAHAQQRWDVAFEDATDLIALLETAITNLRGNVPEPGA
jgi:two-component system chemotaxis response regulator CheB|uniref:chemotaxis protein CheB n=1 Tax=uncultured Sphingomonas sp. TaxID=158754 RepID=UPI0035CC301E